MTREIEFRMCLNTNDKEFDKRPRAEMVKTLRMIARAIEDGKTEGDLKDTKRRVVGAYFFDDGEVQFG